MTLHDTRAVLLRTVLRSGETRRIARVIDRMDSAVLSAMLLRMGEFELRRAASVLFEAQRIERALDTLNPTLVTHLVQVAHDADATRALSAMKAPRAAAALSALPAWRRSETLEALREPQRQAVIRALPRPMRPVSGRLDGVFRLRRLFA